MNQLDVIKIASLTVSVAVPIAGIVWYILTNPKNGKKIAQTAIITSIVVVLLVGGVLYLSMSTTTLGAKQTATPELHPATSSYTTNAPGNGCDTNGGTWIAAASATQCTSNGTIITKTLDAIVNYGGWGEQHFQLPNYSFPTDYSIKVTISNIIDPEGGQACAGISIHRNQGGTFAEVLEVCNDGSMGFISVQNGRPLQSREVNIPINTTYMLLAHITPDTMTLTVNHADPISISAFSSTTSFISLNVFWQNAGTHALFTDFQYSEGSLN